MTDARRDPRPRCPTCNGDGFVVVERVDIDGRLYVRAVPCPTCSRRRTNVPHDPGGVIAT